MPNNLWLWADHPDIESANKWNLIKQYRNELLSASDWTQLPDAVLTFDERTAWQTYRQALRDIPQSYTNPDDVVFQVQP